MYLHIYSRRFTSSSSSATTALQRLFEGQHNHNSSTASPRHSRIEKLQGFAPVQAPSDRPQSGVMADGQSSQHSPWVPACPHCRRQATASQVRPSPPVCSHQIRCFHDENFEAGGWRHAYCRLTRPRCQASPQRGTRREAGPRSRDPDRTTTGRSKIRRGLLFNGNAESTYANN